MPLGDKGLKDGFIFETGCAYQVKELVGKRGERSRVGGDPREMGEVGTS